MSPDMYAIEIKKRMRRQDAKHRYGQEPDYFFKIGFISPYSENQRVLPCRALIFYTCFQHAQSTRWWQPRLTGLRMAAWVMT